MSDYEIKATCPYCKLRIALDDGGCGCKGEFEAWLEKIAKEMLEEGKEGKS
jgi:hypothetical protein